MKILFAILALLVLVSCTNKNVTERLIKEKEAGNGHEVENVIVTKRKVADDMVETYHYKAVTEKGVELNDSICYYQASNGDVKLLKWQ